MNKKHLLRVTPCTGVKPEAFEGVQQNLGSCFEFFNFLLEDIEQESKAIPLKQELGDQDASAHVLQKTFDHLLTLKAMIREGTDYLMNFYCDLSKCCVCYFNSVSHITKSCLEMASEDEDSAQHLKLIQSIKVRLKIAFDLVKRATSQLMDGVLTHGRGQTLNPV